jgi:hypothetical protein
MCIHIQIIFKQPCVPFFFANPCAYKSVTNSSEKNLLNTSIRESSRSKSMRASGRAMYHAREYTLLSSASINKCRSQRISNCMRLQMHVITYADYCDFMVVKSCHGTVDELIDYCQRIKPCGGGDNPEATRTALNEVARCVAIDLNRCPASKHVVILFTDAPPHSDMKTNGIE